VISGTGAILAAVSGEIDRDLRGYGEKFWTFQFLHTSLLANLDALVKGLKDGDVAHLEQLAVRVAADNVLLAWHVRRLVAATREEVRP
jgi:hypothetical protein